jgi:hypothetical protein
MHLSSLGPHNVGESRVGGGEWHLAGKSRSGGDTVGEADCCTIAVITAGSRVMPAWHSKARSAVTASGSLPKTRVI